MYRRSKPKKLRTEVTAIKVEETPAFEEILLRPDEPLGEDEEDDPPTSSASVADVIGMLEVKMDTRFDELLREIKCLRKEVHMLKNSKAPSLVNPATNIVPRTIVIRDPIASPAKVPASVPATVASGVVIPRPPKKDIKTAKPVVRISSPAPDNNEVNSDSNKLPRSHKKTVPINTENKNKTSGLRMLPVRALPREDLLDENYYHFPLSVDHLERLNRNIKDNVDIRERLIKDIRSARGLTLSAQFRSIICDEAMLTYNMHGRCGKNKVGDSPVFNLIRKMWFPEDTEEYEHFMKAEFHLLWKRVAKRRKRSGTQTPQECDSDSD